jgi:hypothetical protein
MDKDMKRLLGLVRSACYSWTGNKRDLESALSIGHGRIEEILDGHPELRVRHLVDLARLLKVRPSDFLRLGYPDDESTAPNQLEGWIGEPKPPSARRKPLPLAPEHEERIRELIREELAKGEK